MSAPSHLRWLDWCQHLQAIVQNGLTFARDHFDVKRYQTFRAIAAEMLAAVSARRRKLKIEEFFALTSSRTGSGQPR